MINSVTDPDALAEEACRVGLVDPDIKDMLVLSSAGAKTKARSLLQSIEGKIKGQPNLFHRLLAVLRNLPELTDLANILQMTYGKA